jgi:tripartite-type tricarboxylate transporter receptor subunit TctC
LKFDAAKELTGVVMIARVPNLLVSGAGFPPTNMKELLDYARARPGQLNYSNPIGAYSHLDMLDFTSKAGLRMVNIPSKGAGASFTAAISGEIHFYFTNAATVTPQVLAGRMKAFATTAQKRLADLPDVPTMAEAGMADFEVSSWNGLAAPAGTPQPIVDKLNAEVNKILVLQEVQRQLQALGAQAVGGSSRHFADHVQAQIQKWREVIQAARIALD